MKLDDARRRELAAYAGACLSMYLQLHVRGGKTLGRVEAHLCEDGQTVALSAWDQEIAASFMLAEKTTQGEFDYRKWEMGLNDADEDVLGESDIVSSLDQVATDEGDAGAAGAGSCELRCDIVSGQGGDGESNT